MTNLITGKEALIALVNGEDVEYTNSTTPSWHDLSKSKMSISELIDGRFNNFRLKPKTITLNGIEVPVCGSNYQEGETIFVFDDCCDERGYIEYSVSGYQYQDSVPKLWWRTEDEIKQVVTALRQVLRG